MLTEEENLISAGASIVRAASNGDAGAVRSLLAEGAAADLRGRGGHTALMVAAIFNQVEIAQILLAAGADVELRDNLGLSARDWADRRGSWDVAQMLASALPAVIEPSAKSTHSKQTQPKPKVARPNRAVKQTNTPQEGDVSDAEQLGKKAEPERAETNDVAASLSDQKAVTISPTLRGTRREPEMARRKAEEDILACSDEPATTRSSDALRFMKFHKQIMAAQERRNAERARLEADDIEALTSAREAVTSQSSIVPTRPGTDLLPFPFEAADSTQPRLTSVANEETIRTRRERIEKETRPRATDAARIAITIEHLRLQEESSPDRTATVGKQGLDHDEDDATLDRPFANRPTRPAMFELNTSESSNPRTGKRCPECKVTFDNPLLKYCAYDATKLVRADEPNFNYPAAKERTRQTLWVLVAIVTVSGASLGYLINNYRSRERLLSAPIAAVSNQPIAVSLTEPPEITRNNLPVISGELSGMEVDVPEPLYPAKARSEGVSGTVRVRIQVNQKGRVVLVRSSGGDWRLRAAAVEAAQKATFSPEKLAAHGKVVSGTITYNFKAQTESPAPSASQTPAPTKPQPANDSPSPTDQRAANDGGDYPVVGGPLAGAEDKLPQPDYPNTAKSRGVNGTITVVIRVNRAGRVISWRTLEGDSQLRAAALKAAKKATFSPAKLPGTGEVVGSITYNFKS